MVLDRLDAGQLQSPALSPELKVCENWTVSTSVRLRANLQSWQISSACLVKGQRERRAQVAHKFWRSKYPSHTICHYCNGSPIIDWHRLVGQGKTLGGDSRLEAIHVKPWFLPTLIYFFRLKLVLSSDKLSVLRKGILLLKVTTETLSGAETETLIEFDSSEIDVFLKVLTDARKVYPVKLFSKLHFIYRLTAYFSISLGHGCRSVMKWVKFPTYWRNLHQIRHLCSIEHS